MILPLTLAFMTSPLSRKPSATAVISIMGVALGISAYLVVLTILNSLEWELKHMISVANPHLMVFRFSGQGMPDPMEHWRRDLAPQFKNTPFENSTERVSTFEYGESILSFGSQTKGILIKGIEPKTFANREEMLSRITPGALELLEGEKTLILGQSLARDLKVSLGETVLMLSPRYHEGFLPFKVVGFFTIGLQQYDGRCVLMSRSNAQPIFGKEGFAKGLDIRLYNPLEATTLAQKIREFTPYGVRPWQEIDRGLFDQIQRDGFSIKLVVFFISLVACLNIFVVLILNIQEKTKHIATLRALGASRPSIVGIFVSMGLILGALGSVLGIAIGMGLLQIFSHLSLGELQKFYFLEKIPVHHHPLLIVQSIGVALTCALLGSLIPALKATAVSPLVGLKPGYDSSF